jgi:hypothetical protein
MGSDEIYEEFTNGGTYDFKDFEKIFSKILESASLKLGSNLDELILEDIVNPPKPATQNILPPNTLKLDSSLYGTFHHQPKKFVPKKISSRK